MRCKNGCSIRRLAEVYIGYLNENLSYFQMMSLFAPRGRISDQDEKMINPAMNELLDLIEGVIKDAGYKGDTRLMSHALFSALNGIMTTYAQNPGMSLTRSGTTPGSWPASSPTSSRWGPSGGITEVPQGLA